MKIKRDEVTLDDDRKRPITILVGDDGFDKACPYVQVRTASDIMPCNSMFALHDFDETMM